jgi:hypothetical protein
MEVLKMIDELTGKPYLLTYKGVHASIKTEKSLDSDGNEIMTRSEVMSDPILTRNYDLAPEWQQKRKWQEILTRIVYKQTNSDISETEGVSLQKTEGIFLVSYVVNTEKCKYLQNAPDGKNYVYLKETPSGLMARDFSTDVTTYFPPNKSLIKHGVYQILSEKEISPNQARILIRDSEVFCGSIGLRQRLGFSSAP